MNLIKITRLDTDFMDIYSGLSSLKYIINKELLGTNS